jgi:hypothetical protein
VRSYPLTDVLLLLRGEFIELQARSSLLTQDFLRLFKLYGDLFVPESGQSPCDLHVRCPERFAELSTADDGHELFGNSAAEPPLASSM